MVSTVELGCVWETAAFEGLNWMDPLSKFRIYSWPYLRERGFGIHVWLPKFCNRFEALVTQGEFGSTWPPLFSYSNSIGGAPERLSILEAYRMF